jgi:hypothetical protein
MTKEELEIAKQKMKDYRDIFGGELSRKDLIDDANSIFQLETILNYHYDYINDMASDAQSSLSNFKREIGVF